MAVREPGLKLFSAATVAGSIRRGSMFFLDAIFVTRPILWIPVWAFAVLGYFRCLTVGCDASYRALWHLRWIADAFWIGIFSASVGAVYVVNQFADLRTDSANAGFPLLAGGYVSARAAWTALYCCVCVSVLTPFFFARQRVAFFSLAALITGALYSLPPTSLSGRPFADFLTNAVGFGLIAFGAGWTLSPGGTSLFSARFLASAAPYVLLMCAGSISSTVPDIPGDQLVGKRTTAVVIGAWKAQLLATGCVVGAAVVAGWQRDWAALLAALAALVWYVVYLVVQRPVLAEATYKVGGASVMVVTALIAPLFACCAAFVCLATWMYFRWRHGVIYPALQPARPLSLRPQRGKRRNAAKG